MSMLQFICDRMMYVIRTVTCISRCVVSVGMLSYHMKTIAFYSTCPPPTCYMQTLSHSLCLLFKRLARPDVISAHITSHKARGLMGWPVRLVMLLVTRTEVKEGPTVRATELSWCFSHFQIWSQTLAPRDMNMKKISVHNVEVCCCWGFCFVFFSRNTVWKLEHKNQKGKGREWGSGSETVCFWQESSSLLFPDILRYHGDRLTAQLYLHH